MNPETALRLQAWVDGELPPAAAREVAGWVERDPEAGALATELRHTHSALREAEPEHRLPVSREFYWSGIEREINRPHAPETARPAPRPFAWLTRFLVPAGILTALGLILAFSLLRGNWVPENTWASEVDSPLEDLSSVTFRSESEGITVVWVNTR